MKTIKLYARQFNTLTDEEYSNLQELRNSPGKPRFDGKIISDVNFAGSWNTDLLTSEWHRRKPETICILAEYQNKVIAWINWKVKTKNKFEGAYCSQGWEQVNIDNFSIYTLPVYRGLGIAKALVCKFFEWCSAHGVVFESKAKKRMIINMMQSNKRMKISNNGQVNKVLLDVNGPVGIPKIRSENFLYEWEQIKKYMKDKHEV